MRIFHNQFSELPGTSAYSFDLPVISPSASAIYTAPAFVTRPPLISGSQDFSALHTPTCCGCGQDHQTLKLLLSQADAEGGGAPLAQGSGNVYAEGDVPGDITTPETIAIGGSVTDTIEVSGDQDWFAVELVAGQRYHITLTGTGLDPLDDPYLEIMDANGNQVAYNDDGGEGLNSNLFFDAETTGTYYVNAHGWEDSEGNTSTGEYTITLDEVEPLTTYTFDEIANFITHEYFSPHRWAQTDLTYDVSGLSAGAQILAIRAMEAWAEITNLTFTEDIGNADITFQDTEDGAYASTSWGASDSEGYGIISTATVNVAADWFGGDLTLDSYTYQTFLHEIGHALGLGHAGPYNGSATYGVDNIYENDNWSYSLMSYFDQVDAGFGSYRFALGPQIADILAIHTLYETNPDGTRTGNTVYGFNSTESDINDWSQFVYTSGGDTYVNPPSYAIYDTGGIDTIDLSGFTHGQILSLIPETFSSLGDNPSSSSPVFVNTVSIARGSIIENAIGGSGNDTITGNDAANLLIGNAGNDTLNGRANNDILRGGLGADTLIGGGGFDTADYSDATAGVTVHLWNGTASGNVAQGDTLTSIEAVIGSSFNDRLFGSSDDDTLNGGGSNDFLNGGGGNDILIGAFGADTLNGGAGFDTADYSDATAGVTVQLWNGTGSGNAAQGDTLSSIEAIIGSSFNDRLIGSSDDNTLNGGGSNDFLNGGGGNDILIGAFGADTLIGGTGFDTADYSDATAGVTVQLWNGTGSGNAAQGDTLSSIEAIIGSSFNDRLIGSSDNNTLNGGGSNDFLNGGGGNDILIGSFGADTLIGGAGFDTADYSDATAGVTVQLWNGTGSGNAAQGDTLSSIEAIIGSSFDDRLIGSSDNNTLNGGGGNDFLNGGGGNDFLNGGGGNDTLRGSFGADALNGGAGFDTADYSDATAGVTVQLWNGTGSGNAAQGDTLTSIEAIIGSSFNDRLIGSSDNNTLNGGGSNDFLNGGGGNDILIGGFGADTFAYLSGADVIEDFGTGNGDVIDLTNIGSVSNMTELQALYSQSGSDAVFDFGGGNTLTVRNHTWSDLSSGDFLFSDAAAEVIKPGMPVAEVQGGSDIALQEAQFDFSKLGSTEYSNDVVVEHAATVFAMTQTIEQTAVQAPDFIVETQHTYFDYDVQLHHDDFFLV